MSSPSGGQFVHLHNHMEGSYSDSALPMASALDRVVELGMNAFGLTDHGEMAMVPAFAREAAARGIKPIVGFEAYFVEDADENIRRRVNDRYHLTLIAGNQRGYENLLRICSLSWRDNCLMQKLGLVDWKLLEKYSEGIVCLSGCLAGPVGWSFLKDKPAEADRFYGRFSEVFGEQYFIEVYEHGMAEEKKAVEGLLEIASRYGRRLVLTNDCHYLDPPDWELHDTLIKTRFGKPSDFELPYHEYFIKSPAQMRALAFPGACCDATLEIAELITLTAGEITASREDDPSAPVETAFLQVRSPIGFLPAVEKAAGVQRLSRREQQEVLKLSREELRERHPRIARIAEKIESLPVKPEPDTSRVAVRRNLSARVPLRRSEKLLFTMWTEEECVAAGAEIRPVEEFPDLLPQALATRAYTRGLDEYKRRKLEKARASFRESIDHDPSFSNARYQLGLVEYYDDRIEDALRHFEEVLRREPDFERLPHLQSYLGWCYFRLSEDSKARASFSSSIKDKEIPGSLLGLGLTYERLGDFERARETLLRLFTIAPDFPRLHTAQKALLRLEDRLAHSDRS
ncbi:MAG: PHP domain-containing protein [Candidatus Hydrogenedentota bacterium]